MTRVITAIGNPNLNEILKMEENIELINNDIQYQEGIFEILEKEKNVDFIILSEILSGQFSILELIEKIKLINFQIKIIIILEEKRQELENILIAKGIFKIIYNNQIEIKEIINILKNNKDNYNNENEELRKEINNLKNIIIENQNKNKYLNKIKNKQKNNLKINNSKKININKKIKNKFNKLSNKNKININNKEIITICGPSGVGKSIISVNLAKSLIYQSNKILIIDFDILNNSLHTILGVKKYPNNLKQKIEKNNLQKNKLNVEDFIIKINKKIDLISAIDILFNINNFQINKLDNEINNKINLIKLEKFINLLKNKYNIIIIDTSSECFFEFTKTLINLSNKNIFVTETNILEIKKAKNLLHIYINEWKIKKNKINILFNKYDKNSININLLKKIFDGFNIIGSLKYNAKYNRLINKNIKNSFLNKNIRKEYLNIKNNL